MSKYDDIQQFKDKINMKNIDYKEIPNEQGASAALQRWSILAQVAAEDLSHPLSNARQGQQPIPVSATEFAINVPPLIASTTEHVYVPPATVAPRALMQQVSTAMESPRFKKLFSKKTASHGLKKSGRDTPLKPLLEMIASCR